MSDEVVRRRVAAFFTTIAEDLEAVDALTSLGNRLAAYHMQQALEKLTKAALLSQGIEAGIEHRLDVLLRRLPDGDACRTRLWPLRGYSTYATAFRYPTPGGRLVDAPPREQLAGDLKALREHVEVMFAVLIPKT